MQQEVDFITATVTTYYLSETLFYYQYGALDVVQYYTMIV